jgi:glycosyltransferase involved in cell wall biosynthesis
VPEIGVAGLPLDYPHSGTAVYLRNLFPLLPEAAPDLDFRLFFRRSSDVETCGRARVQGLRTLAALGEPRSQVVARTDKLAWETLVLPVASALRREALLHVPYFAAPVFSVGALVVTIHDLVPLALPDYHRGWASRIYSRLMAGTVARADAIITVSEHSKRDIMRLLGISEWKIHVIYEAVDGAMERGSPGTGESLRQRYGIPSPYVLYIGGAEKRKNIATLVRAWSKITSFTRSFGVHLVAVARFPTPDALYPDIGSLIGELGLDDDVVIVAEVDNRDKLSLYRSALALCFPSSYEGFGLTPLEAMGAGTPVIASNATSIPEVVGDAGVLLPPLDVDAWADAIRRIVGSETERQAMSAAGLRRAARFSWRRAAEETVAVYKEALAR